MAGYAQVASALERAADAAGVPRALLRAVAHIETGGSYRADLTSRKGAMGLMQIMPGTAQGLGLAQPYDPSASAMAAAMYLRQLYQRFGSWPQAIAAYNWGPGNVGGATDPPKLDPLSWPKSVQSYVKNVLGQWQTFAPVDTVPSFLPSVRRDAYKTVVTKTVLVVFASFMLGRALLRAKS